jgi:hypothetical protein
MSEKITAKEIARREADLTSVLDAKNLIDLEERRPDVVERIRALLDVGHTARKVGRVMGRIKTQFDNDIPLWYTLVYGNTK